MLHISKRLIASAALIGFAFSFVSTAPAYASYQKVDGAYQLLDGTSIDGVIARGIDVSHWQGTIDWSKVSKDDIEFVMLGTRYSGMTDPNFHTNATNAVKENIKIGAYIYSYATNAEMALQEADFILDLVKDYPISYPIAYDIEDNVQSNLSPQEVSTMINAFCNKIEAAGYHPMVYANDYWLANKIDLSMIDFDIWVARYEVKHAFENPAMWQATSKGSVSGINGNVDINFQYKDFSSLIAADAWRTIAGKTYYYKNFVMQKDTWVNDNGTWYYTDSDGQKKTGWFNHGQKSYYLSDSGAMATGWESLDNSWYYFNSSGAMSSGWINDNGTWYYTDTDGKMRTGWLTQDRKHYFLRPSGAMATGWRHLDNIWYYFNGSGAMVTGWLNDNGTWYYTDTDGKMRTGWLTENGQHYYLDLNSGAMYANTNINVNDVNYSVNASGHCTEITAETDDPGIVSETFENLPDSDVITVPEPPDSTDSSPPTVEIGPGINR